MKRLIIIGAGGFGREVYTLAKSCIGYGSLFTIKGFLDKNKSALGGRNGYAEILSDVDNYEIMNNDVFIVAIADPSRKEYCVNNIIKRSGKFISLIHSTAVISDNVKVGKGCIISRDCIISNDVEIKSHTSFNSKVMIGHDCKIDKFCHFNAGSFVGGEVLINQKVVVHTMAIIIPRLIIGNNVIVGVGSVVLKNIPSDKTVFGNPARVIF
jgi:sugar O-acyltransferase (sialic acid O-acetyltransferase NeuD family)